MGKVLLIATGGTIAMRKDARGKAVPAVSGHDLLASLPALVQEADWEVFDFSNLASCNMSPERMLELAGEIEHRLLAEPDIQGVVVTHGTDTLEETAYFLDLTIRDSRPIILTASQRDASERDSDGPRNLRGAMLIALDRHAWGRGVIIALNEEIHAARDVRKLHTSSVDAFSSGEIGALGNIDNGDVIWHRRPEPTVKLGLPEHLAHVGIIKAYTGMPVGQIEMLIKQGLSGLVIEAFGRGNLPPQVVPEIERTVSQGVPVVITSRCLFGRTAPVYGYPGGGADLERAGAWFASDLSTEKVRLLMAIALAQGIPMAQIKSMLAGRGAACP
ncbi:asparaginase [Paradesulfitobacterium ferrireducens]|uniref:asparaginase n=1 Tax=Paradesulfitobacterium ferrireducens TaxID=2816476 RepID=UPI001A8C9A3D|nr:asparaginase [Paradesulfitobacterium ferrireducens]